MSRIVPVVGPKPAQRSLSRRSFNKMILQKASILLNGLQAATAMFLLFAVVAFAAQRKDKPKMRIQDPGRSEFRLEPYNAQTHSVFEPVFTNPQWAPMRPYAVVLSNATPH